MKKKFINIVLSFSFLSLSLAALSSCSFVSNIVSNTIIGLSISDNKTAYNVGDVYKTTNSLTVIATYSNNKKADITNSGNYTIVIKDSYDSTVDETSGFSSAGEYKVYVRYLLIYSNTLTFNVLKNDSSQDSEYNYDPTIKQDPNKVFTNQELLTKSYDNYSSASIGKVKALIIPIEIKGYSFQSTILEDINITFNGTSDDTNYFESVSSYYYKTSYGKLDFDFTVAPVYQSSYTPNDIKHYNNKNLINKAVNDYIANNDTKQFDSDGDGFIDMTWFVYSCHNGSADTTLNRLENGSYETFWAYSTDMNGSPNVSAPVVNSYGWASYDFMFEVTGFKRYSSSTKFDAHTFIHETGHLLGLDDYYSYDSTVNIGPLGGLDMMDFNIGDHNAFSKMLLGWTNPYVVSGDVTKQTYTINSSSISNDAILVCNNWNGTVFDEYLLIELYSPDGLNRIDSKTVYSNVKMFSTYGVRIYHIDNRLLKFSYKNGSYYADYSSNGFAIPMKDSEIKAISSLPNKSDKTSLYAILTSNTQTNEYSYDSRYSLIQAITANKVNTVKSKTTCSNESLFKEGDTFTMSEYGSTFFYNNNRFNNGDSFDYSITVNSLSSSKATITLEKVQ